MEQRKITFKYHFHLWYYLAITLLNYLAINYLPYLAINHMFQVFFLMFKRLVNGQIV